MAAAPGLTNEKQRQCKDRDGHGHRPDIDYFELCIEGVDVLAERVLHVAKLLPHGNDFAPEILDLLPLFVGQNVAAALPAAAQFLQSGFGVAKLEGELLFRFAVLGLGVAPDFLGDDKRPV